MTGNRTERARRYLGDVAQSGSLDELVEAIPENAGPGGTSELERPILEKLALGHGLAPREEFALEAIIIPDKRPAIDIVDGTYTAAHASWLHLNEPATLARLETTFPSIGRVEIPGHPTAPYGGTAFVVGEGLLMTNRHVAELFAGGLGTRGLHFIPGRGGAVDFHRERGDTAHEPISATRLLMVHPFWDMALFEIDGLPAGHRPLTLEITDPEEFVGRDIAVVGYPAFDVRNPHDVQHSVFGGAYGIKRLQPGKMRGRARINSYDRIVSAPTHDSSTLGGNSGSCVIDIASGRVIALHFGGRYLQANYAVAAGDLALDGRVIDAGVRFSAVPEPGPAPWEAAWREIAAPEIGEQEAEQPVRAMARGGTELTIPLEISIRLGQDQTQVSIARPGSVETALAHDPDYSTRRGYDPYFLGAKTGLPVPREPEKLVQALDGERILHYHHFSVFMHADRRLAAMTAANVDLGTYRDRGLTAAQARRWMCDPRIDPSAQLPESPFRGDPAPIVSGHFVRCEDVAWGDGELELQYAVSDCYHVTNRAPKIAATRPIRDGWGDLETHVAGQNDGTQLSVFSGPVLEPDDPEVGAAGADVLQIPRAYWKLIVARKGNDLRAYGFLLRQDLLAMPREFDLPESAVRFMQPVTALEKLSGFDFDAAIRKADMYGSPDGVRLAAAAEIGASDPGRAAPDQAVSDALADIEEILEFWRESQSGDDDTDPARFVLELGQPVPDGTLQQQLSDELGIDLAVGPLFDGEVEGDGELDRYRLVEIPGIGEADRADLFDVARTLRALTDAIAVEPDLGTRYYDSDPLSPPDGTAEGGNIAFWCWADEDKAPADADWAIKRLKLPDAWNRSDAAGRPARGAGSVIFQPDTGVVRNHPDIPSGLADDPRAANFVERGTPPVDPMSGSGNLGHGTATGSVAASPASHRVTGAAPKADLVPLRALRSVVRFEQSRVAAAVNHARLNGAHVITMSLGGVPSSALRAAIRKAVAQNIIVLAAAGNCVGSVVWPARYREVVAVGGVNAKDRPWQGSSRGRSVDISAPAEFVLRADARDPGDPARVSGGQGTSFATAMLAGVAACWLSHHGRDALISALSRGETLQDLFRRLLRATVRVPPGFDTDRYGAGIVDADAFIATDPAAAGAPETAAPDIQSVEREILEIFREAGAPGRAEAAAQAVGDPQSVLELACVALDMARYRNIRHRNLEAQPPVGLSRGLKARMGGPSATGLLREAV